MLVHASLFTGLGAFDLAAEKLGWKNEFQVEIDEYCQKLLVQNFPKTTKYQDIKEFDASIYANRIDVLTGGFPCQPWSQAGSRKGTEDERHLWPEMFRVISECKPSWVVAENVYGIINWGQGLQFESMLVEMESIGYELQPFIIPAASVGTRHNRRRVFVIAYSDSFRYSRRDCLLRESERQGQTGKQDDRECIQSEIERLGSVHRAEQGFEWMEASRKSFERLPLMPTVCRGSDRDASWVDRIKSLGNAIQPQVAYVILKNIQKTYSYDLNT